MKQAHAFALTTESEMDPRVKRYIEQFSSKNFKAISRFPDSYTLSPNITAEQITSEVRPQAKKEPAFQIIPQINTVSEDRGIAHQKWEGVVIEIKKDTFTARLFDKTINSPEEEAEIFISDVSEDDRSLMKAGAVFYLSVGYTIKKSGQRIRGPIIKFRRVPAWTRKELREIDLRIKERKELIGWSSARNTSCI